MYVLLDQFNIGTIRRIRTLYSVLEILIDLNLSLNIEIVQLRI